MLGLNEEAGYRIVLLGEILRRGASRSTRTFFPLRVGKELQRRTMNLAQMARASETSCCRYFLYSSADASVTIIKQTIAIPPYLRVFLIMFSSAMQSSSHDTRRPAHLVSIAHAVAAGDKSRPHNPGMGSPPGGLIGQQEVIGEHRRQRRSSSGLPVTREGRPGMSANL